MVFIVVLMPLVVFIVVLVDLVSCVVDLWWVLDLVLLVVGGFVMLIAFGLALAGFCCFLWGWYNIGFLLFGWVSG